MNKRFLPAILFLLLFSTLAFAVAPDVNVNSPQAGESYSVGTIVTIDINVWDDDTNASEMGVDLNYAIAATQGTGTSLLPAGSILWTNFTCDSNNLQRTADETVGCSYSWNTDGVNAGCKVISTGTPITTACDYYILVNVTDTGGGTDFNAGYSYVRLTTTESVNVNITNIGTLINRSIQLSENVIGGVRDQGGLMGLAIGLTIAISLLITVLFLAIDVLPKITEKIRRLK